MYKIIENKSELEALDYSKPIFCDIETEKLYVNTRLIQFYQPNLDEVLIWDTDVLPLDLVLPEMEKMHLVFHNASYDLGTLNIVPKDLDDTFYLARLAYPEWGKFGLDIVTSKLQMGSLYAKFDKKTIQKAGFKKGAVLSDEQLEYSATDVIALAKIWENTKIQRAREIMAYRVDILSLKYAVQYQQNGLIPDRDAVRRELKAIEGEIEENYRFLNGLNPNSPKQVKEALNIDSSAKDVLIKLIAENNEKSKLAEVVYKQRRLLKRRTMLESYDRPIVYTKFNPNGAATGRFTSKGGDLDDGINAQQITRDLQYIFNTPSEEYSIVHADYSTAELRAGCSIMGDDTMANELKNFIDLHKAAAHLATGKPIEKITKEDRQKGKAVSFGFIFGMSAAAFVEYAYVNYGVKFTLQEAQIIKKKYTTKYRNIAKYHNYWWEHYKKDVVKSPMGHRNKPRLGTDAINYATQACTAETTKLAIIKMVEKDEKILDYIYNVVHDAIYLRVPVGKEDHYAKFLTECMLDSWYDIEKLPMLRIKGIPMGVEYEVAKIDSGKLVEYSKEVFSKDEL
jgi:DNA polymerase I-like protein with 3'-5' exonuclease and polymerase domains